ncbi:MAG: c-type cytochrome [Holophagaceae bacterium]|nr:c-type cytochrome [Holophagaceae bacterium]
MKIRDHVRRRMRWLLLAAFIVGIPTGMAGWIVIRGVSARDEPTRFEEVLARSLRHAAIPAAQRRAPNPVERTPEVIEEGKAHWADHCAQCHGNDGRGRTEMGRNLFPKAPDMTESSTQKLSDGELFAIIKNGIRLSGMPAWGDNSPSSDLQSWKLVHFIRHLPNLSAAEVDGMKAMNPVSPGQAEQVAGEEAFLNPGSSASAPRKHH